MAKNFKKKKKVAKTFIVMTKGREYPLILHSKLFKEMYKVWFGVKKERLEKVFVSS